MGGFLSNAELAALDVGAILTADIADLAVTNAKLALPSGRTLIAVPVTLDTLLVGGGEIVTDILPGFAGTIDSIFFVTGTPGVGAGATFVVTVEIGAVALTGGELTIDLATTATLGEYIAAAAVTATNVFTDTDLLSILHAAGTVFTGGAGVIIIVCSVAGQ